MDWVSKIGSALEEGRFRLWSRRIGGLSGSSQRRLQEVLLRMRVDIEPRLRKVMGYRHLPKLRQALQRELRNDTKTSTRKVA